jgi:hypothetical protein
VELALPDGLARQLVAEEAACEHLDHGVLQTANSFARLQHRRRVPHQPPGHGMEPHTKIRPDGTG